ncbi:hypothetical protein JYU34_003565 [Plutella xylostella]|uniref:Uncharacterized protein n=1 Tax=Plutella xylostella TaxID=51655 RepID=A0ABQ7R0E2_PLUXY|nr:hypothetical protein JYU34_003565 [Plutella xylostella]
MTGIWICWIVLSGITQLVSSDISTKLDFGNEEDALSATAMNSTQDDDVEVKHTIVVSTKLKNSNNRRGLHGGGNEEERFINIGRTNSNKKVDSGEVPVYSGMRAVETTKIRTPDTRYNHKPQVYPDAVLINRNIRDDYDVYPNVATNPQQWQPSSFFNNINWFNAESSSRNYNIARRLQPPLYQNRNPHSNKKIEDDAMKDFYCKRCRELSGFNGCNQQRSSPWTQPTTPKMKIDGKLAKLN